MMTQDIQGVSSPGLVMVCVFVLPSDELKPPTLFGSFGGEIHPGFIRLHQVTLGCQTCGGVSGSGTTVWVPLDEPLTQQQK